MVGPKAVYPTFIIVLVNVKRSQRHEEGLSVITSNTAMRFVDPEYGERRSTTGHVILAHLSMVEEDAADDRLTTARGSQ